jgi:LPPG:FO 2-phospho-L-lactate transferase
VIEAIKDAEVVILTPSNPLVSIGPILSVQCVRDALRQAEAKVAAVSPIVGGKTIKGPADRMLRDQGIEPSATSIAQLYSDFLDLLVIDNVDEALAPAIEGLGVRAVVTNTIMDTMEKKVGLAAAVIAAARE